MGKIVIICTSENMMAHKDGSAPHQTGLWLEEAAAPYYVFAAAGHEVSFASIKGGAVPIDPASMEGDFFTEDAKKFMHDGQAFGKMCASEPVSALKPENFDAIYLSGGHGTVADFVSNEPLQKLIADMYGASKVVAAVCHAPTALVNASFEGKPLLDGKAVTGFSNEEEGPNGVNLMDKVEVVLEDAMKAKGASYSAKDPWTSNIAVDETQGRCLMTGQNPQSSKELAEALVTKLAGGSDERAAKVQKIM